MLKIKKSWVPNSRLGLWHLAITGVIRGNIHLMNNIRNFVDRNRGDILWNLFEQNKHTRFAKHSMITYQNCIIDMLVVLTDLIDHE